ncbi:hypothetical protein [Mangrovihabitans endophyticus]|uniref:Uncharacterized protein n=1 Tax=Mangrovihabitans endophyticus TaxID=1751298 RepID=A0A8J3FPY8_9ACTN|nr:hypothetical protein [Mangrovihabitans endophyticus]GGL05235.1 hypothetical protein GCM10012284_44660 [Mangrovihabitans endophyticus]
MSAPGDHLPDDATQDCVICDPTEAWPCRVAQDSLPKVMRPGRLLAFMHERYMEAADARPDLLLVDLHRRFLGWLPFWNEAPLTARDIQPPDTRWPV